MKHLLKAIFPWYLKKWCLIENSNEVKQRNDLIISFYYYVTHHGLMPCVVSIIGCKHDVILRQEKTNAKLGL